MLVNIKLAPSQFINESIDVLKYSSCIAGMIVELHFLLVAKYAIQYSCALTFQRLG